MTRVVGIGASAGGLDALEQFLARVPAASGLAYVIVRDGGIRVCKGDVVSVRRAMHEGLQARRMIG